jgi:putative ABC transport system permease protein
MSDRSPGPVWLAKAAGSTVSARPRWGRTRGVNAIIGRTLTETDDRIGNPQPVVVISYDFWQRRFGLDPAVIGRRITLDDRPLTIVGVAPPGFFGFEVGGSPDI